MKEAGIDTSVYTAHSTRGAATSKAKAMGVPTADILKAAKWNSALIFCRFYNTPSSTSQFGQVVLSNGQITGPPLLPYQPFIYCYAYDGHNIVAP